MAGSSAMEEFEHQFAAISAEITSKINKIPQLLGGKYTFVPTHVTIMYQMFYVLYILPPDFTFQRRGCRILQSCPLFMCLFTSSSSSSVISADLICLSIYALRTDKLYFFLWS